MAESPPTDLDHRLDELEAAYDAVAAELATPGAAADPDRLRDLGRRFAELEAVVRPYRAFREARAAAAEARDLAAAESDPELSAYFDEEAARQDARKLLSLDAARADATPIDWSGYTPPAPAAITPGEPLVFLARGCESTAGATAAGARAGPPANRAILTAHT